MCAEQIADSSKATDRTPHYIDLHHSRRGSSTVKRALAVAWLVACVGLVVVLTGSLASDREHSATEEERRTRQRERRQATNASAFSGADPCDFSLEAKRAGLPAFLEKIKQTYLRANPFIVLYRSEMTTDQMRRTYRPYNPTPSRLRAITDSSLALADELENIRLDKRLLKIRERRTLSLAKHFLRYHFGSPYQNNYYTGSWMSGPGRRCTSEGIAYVRLQVATIFLLFRPSSAQVLESVFASLGDTGQGIRQYKDNVQRGVVSGMVHTRDECNAGFRCLSNLYPGFGDRNDGQVILKWIHPASYVFNMTKFLSSLHANPAIVHQWRMKYNSTIIQSFKRVLVEQVGRPLADLMYYLKYVHPLNCLPNDVVNGLASRPTHYIYFNGSRTSRKTLPYLDEGEILSGSGAYGTVLEYLSTTSYSPEEVNQMGWKMIGQLYPLAIQIAKNITGHQNEAKAVEEFKKYINRPEMFLNEQPFPANESDARAHQICNNVNDAKKYCPVRYATMQKWFKLARASIAHIDPLLSSIFHHAPGPKKTTPSCPVDVRINFDPSDGVQSYQQTQSWCPLPGEYRIPFFVDRMGPKYSEWAVSAHEAAPGHHLQLQGYLEHFRDVCPSFALLDHQQYTAFTEGWAMYAENPTTAIDLDLYKDHPLAWYGMLKGQLWRALRLVIDTGLHFRNMPRDEAVTLFKRYLWETGDIPEKEVSRYQSWAGQATTYMIGQLAIWDMRRNAEKRLGDKFNLKDFHYYVLSNGQVPLNFIKEHVEMYVECVLDQSGNGCQEMLAPDKPVPGRSVRREITRRDRNTKYIWKLKQQLRFSSRVFQF